MRLPSPTSRRKKKVYLSILDVVWALVSPLLALWLGSALVLSQRDWSLTAIYCALSFGFAVVAFLAFRLQDSMARHFSAHEALDIVEAVLFAQLMTGGLLFALTRLDGIARSVPLYNGFLLAVGLIFIRILTRGAGEEEGAIDFQSRRERIIVIGTNRLASSFISMLKAYKPGRAAVVAVLEEKSGAVGRALGGVQVLGTSQDLDAIVGEFAVHGVQIDRVILAGDTDLLSSAALHDVERVCKKRHLALSFLPRMLGLTEPASYELNERNVAAAAEPAFERHFFLRLKRLIDIVGSLVLMVLLLPMFAVATLLVFIDVGSPVLFWQERIGWRRRPFLIYKYRTLRAPFDPDGRPAVGDRQPSAIGRFLRATRIDELPQLMNVLLGDMSLIGPRPLLPEDQPSNTALRLSVRPGITGWAQINGAKLVVKEDKEAFDEWYVRNASLWVDTRIALLTLRYLGRNYLGSAEASADLAQVQDKRANLAMPETALPKRAPAQKGMQGAATPPLRANVVKRSG
jgi:lipopolysaccharide/colanic/teichoic acid biosynthesis glycosyltransferase